MRWLAVLPAAVGIVAAVLPGWSRPGGDWVVLVSGDTDGYLAPCGCTSPMSGGIQRRATAIRALSLKDRTLVVENGGLVAGRDRHAEIKAETMAEFLAKAGVDAIHLTPSEASLGAGTALSLASLADGRFVSTSLRPSPGHEVKPFLAKGPFLVGGVANDAFTLARSLGEQSFDVEAAVERLLEEASIEGKAPVLLFSGGRDEAKALAEAHPDLRLIVYRRAGAPTESPERVGAVWLVSPGEKGKSLLRLTFRDGAFANLAVANLGPEYADDESTQRIYRAYLRRVSDEDLLGRLPREDGPAFAGSAKCGSCHVSAAKAWEASSHSRALATLEKTGHERNPDCVGCHVVGLSSSAGFRSRKATPGLTDVGCESCHGPGEAHARGLSRVKMPKVGEKACASCHVPDHSPNFDFAKYWPQIAH